MSERPMSSETVSLLPCPFCGGAPEMQINGPTSVQAQHMISMGEDWDVTHYAACQCTATGPERLEEIDAIAAWNNRSKPVASGVEVKPLTPTERLAVSMTDDLISNALDEECETILQLIIHDQSHQIAEHVGAIKSWSSTLRGRQSRLPKATAPLVGEPVAHMLEVIDVLLDNCHVVEDIDIAAQHDKVKELVRMIASPQPLPKAVTEEAINKGAEALRKMYHGGEDEPFHLMAKAVLEAAMKEA